MQIGMEMPSRAMGITHLALAGVATMLALLRPTPVLRRTVLGTAVVGIVLVSASWVGPLWTEPPPYLRGAFGFFLGFLVSLGIPFGLAVCGHLFLTRRWPDAGIVPRLGVSLALYAVGLILPFPMSFNSLVLDLLRS
jgi:hypothetical protein